MLFFHGRVVAAADELASARLFGWKLKRLPGSDLTHGRDLRRSNEKSPHAIKKKERER